MHKLVALLLALCLMCGAVTVLAEEVFDPCINTWYLERAVHVSTRDGNENYQEIDVSMGTSILYSSLTFYSEGRFVEQQLTFNFDGSVVENEWEGMWEMVADNQVRITVPDLEYPIFEYTDGALVGRYDYRWTYEHRYYGADVDGKIRYAMKNYIIVDEAEKNVSEEDFNVELKLIGFQLPEYMMEPFRLMHNFNSSGSLVCNMREGTAHLELDIPYLTVGLFPIEGYTFSESGTAEYRYSTDGTPYVFIDSENYSAMLMKQKDRDSYKLILGNHMLYLLGDVVNSDYSSVLNEELLPTVGQTDVPGMQKEQMSVEAAAQPTPIGYIVITDGANIRTAPDGSATKVKTAYKGEVYPLLGEEGTWYKIEVDGQVAYVVKGLAKIQ